MEGCEIMDDKKSLNSVENFENFEIFAKDIKLAFKDDAFDYSGMAKTIQNSVLQSKRGIEENAKIWAEMDIAKMNAEAEFKNNILNTLIAIEKNTAHLKNIVELVKDSNENQEKILMIINDFLLLSKEKDKESVEKKFNMTMKKISDIGENVDIMNKLYTFGTTIYSIMNSLGIGQ